MTSGFIQMCVRHEIYSILSTNQHVAGSNPSCSNLHVTLGIILNPKLPLQSLECECVHEFLMLKSAGMNVLVIRRMRCKIKRFSQRTKALHKHQSMKSWQLHNLEQLRPQRPRPPKEKCAFPNQLAKGCWLLLGENGCKCSKNIIVTALVAH